MAYEWNHCISTVAGDRLAYFFHRLLLFMPQSIMPEKIIKKNHVIQAQILFILLSIAIGSAVSNFFLEISYWSGRIPVYVRLTIV